MAYIKNTWKDQDVERPKTYEFQKNSDGSTTLIDSFGIVTDLGTPVNAENLNKIEAGIAGTAIRLHNMIEVFAQGEWVKDGESIYRSLKSQNKGHKTSESDWYKKVNLGGASKEPLEIFSLLCDSTFVPKGSSKLNGTEYPASMYQELWDNKLAIQGDNTCSYEEYQIQMDTKGYCLKVAVDISRQTFKIPTVTDEQMSAIYGNIPVQGNGMALGLTNGVDLVGLKNGYTSSGLKFFNGSTEAYGQPVGTDTPKSDTRNKYEGYGVTQDSSKSGIEADLTRPQDRLTLHWFISLANGEVGEFQVHYDQLAKLIDGKANVDMTNTPFDIPYPTVYNPDNTWYRKWKSGRLEQGGRIMAKNGTKVTMPLPYKNPPYLIAEGSQLGAWVDGALGIYEVTTTSFETWFTYKSPSDKEICWYADGQGVQ